MEVYEFGGLGVVVTWASSRALCAPTSSLSILITFSFSVPASSRLSASRRFSAWRRITSSLSDLASSFALFAASTASPDLRSSESSLSLV
jgi:hypothetical protein